MGLSSEFRKQLLEAASGSRCMYSLQSESQSLHMGSSDESWVAHVGLPKTASTYLQLQYFPRLPLANYYSTTAPYRWPKPLRFLSSLNWLWYEDLLTSVTPLPPQKRRLRFDERARRRLRFWHQSIAGFPALKRCSGVSLISAEGLCGYASEVNTLMVSLLKLARINKVIFVCRRQADYAVSLWRQFLLAEDRLARFMPFEAMFGGSTSEGVVGLDWNPYIDAMDQAFGAPNVLVLPYELLKADADCFFRRINTFMGFPADLVIPDSTIEVNPTKSDLVYRGCVWDEAFLLRRLPWLRRRLHGLVARYPGLIPSRVATEFSMVVPGEVLDGLQARFGAANVRLESRLGLSLKSFSYY